MDSKEAINSKLGYEIAEKLPNARLEVIDKSGHYVHMDTPHQLAQLVTSFLDEDVQPQAVITERRA